MEETAYHALVERAFGIITEMLDDLYSKGDIDLTEADGVIEVTIENGGGVFVINRHVPTRQIWLSSPISGAYHFIYDEKSDSWRTKEAELISTLKKEILNK